MFLVIDGESMRPGITTGGNELTHTNEQYRIIAMTGGTYSEQAFRKWVSNTWKTAVDAPIAELVKACNKGGWRVLQLIELA